MLVAGDSLTAGFFATTKDRGFIRLVADDIGSVDVTGGAAQAQQTLSTVAAVTDVPSDVGVAVVELGTNDVGVPTPLADFDSSMRAFSIASDRRRRRPGCSASALDRRRRGLRRGHRALVRGPRRRVRLARELRDAEFHGPAGRETFAGAGDEFHPNDAGHRAIADAVLAALTH